MQRRQLDDVGIDGDQLHSEAHAGDESPYVDPFTRALKGHDRRGGGIPHQRPGEDGLASEAIGGVAECDDADPQSRERGENERAEPRYPQHVERGEETQGFGGE
jgi:hypothetical protein